jgi:hypothetical protein
MTLAVHFVACNTQIEMIGVDPLQIPGVSGPDSVRRRVVELWDPSVEIVVADVVMNDREIPEALSLMYEADEIHIHGIIPRIALKMIPQSRLELLEQTPLVVHGPWAGTADLLTSMGGENEIVWPGPVIFDASARACWTRDVEDGMAEDDATAEKAKEAEDRPRTFFFDVHRGPMVPLAAPQRPQKVDGGYQVSIFLPPEYAESARDAIVEQLEAHATGGVQVELCHDQKADPLAAARTRRYAHLCIAPLMNYWATSRTSMGAMAQRVPLIVVGDHQDIEQPPGVAVVEDFEALGPILTQCFAAWGEGNVAPLDPEAARAWLLERVAR